MYTFHPHSPNVNILPLLLSHSLSTYRFIFFWTIWELQIRCPCFSKHFGVYFLKKTNKQTKNDMVLQNCNIQQYQEIKIGTSLLFTFHSSFTIFPKSVFYRKGFCPESCIAYYCLFILLQSETIPPSFLDFHDLDTLEDYRPGIW